MNASLAEIWRYPIKSMQGESLTATELIAAGIYADRNLGLRDVATGKLLSAKHPLVGEQLLTLTATFVTEPQLQRPLPPVRVELDDTTVLTSDMAAVDRFCSELLGLEVQLETAGTNSADTYESYWPEVEGTVLSDIAVDLPAALAHQGSFADLEPLHILTTTSLAALTELSSQDAGAPARFRPGLLLDTSALGQSGFIESDWAGRRARLGQATLEFGEPTPRCIMPTHAQPGLDKDRSLLKTLARHNLRQFEEFGEFASLGVYARIVEPGRVAVGDQLVFN